MVAADERYLQFASYTQKIIKLLFIVFQKWRSVVYVVYVDAIILLQQQNYIVDHILFNILFEQF